MVHQLDWTMRTAVRAELRELGIDTLGMDSADDANRAIATGGLPNVIVAEATAELISNPRIKDMVQHVPTVLIASRTVEVSLPDALAERANLNGSRSTAEHELTT